MTIRIVTKIDSGIYASQGGGQTKVQVEAATNAANLLRLAPQVAEIARQATAALGNVGHNGTWMEIDGKRIGAFDLADLAEADEAEYPGGPRRTRTEKAKRLIASVQQ